MSARSRCTRREGGVTAANALCGYSRAGAARYHRCRAPPVSRSRTPHPPPARRTQKLTHSPPINQQILKFPLTTESAMKKIEEINTLVSGFVKKYFYVAHNFNICFCLSDHFHMNMI